MSKKNRAALRRTLLTLSLVLVVAFAAVGGTIAWLTASTEVVTNTFVVGDVDILLDEAKVNAYGKPVNANGEEVELASAPRVTENEYKLLPGHTYTKDPTVYVVAGSEPCYVFVKIQNDLAAIETSTIADQMKANHWLPLAGEQGVYFYAGADDDENGKEVDALNANANIKLPVFANFTIDGTKTQTEIAAYVTNEAKTQNIITVDAYAVQKDTFDSAADAWKAAPANWAEPVANP